MDLMPRVKLKIYLNLFLYNKHGKNIKLIMNFMYTTVSICGVFGFPIMGLSHRVREDRVKGFEEFIAQNICSRNRNPVDGQKLHIYPYVFLTLGDSGKGHGHWGSSHP